MASAVVIAPMIAGNFNSESAPVGSVLTAAVGGYATFGGDALSIAGDVVMGVNGNYRGVVQFETPGALIEAPWLIGTITVDPLKHDNVLYAGYNARRNNVAGTWERQETGEHAVLFAIESRFHPTDPEANRGQLEWYLRLDPALTGTPTWGLEPFSLVYNFDLENTSVVFGDPDDAGNTFTFYGGTGGYMAVRDAPLYIRGSTSTDRLTLSMTSSGDTAQISAYDELAGNGLNLYLTAGGTLILDVETVSGDGRIGMYVDTTPVAWFAAGGLGLGGNAIPRARLDVGAGAVFLGEMTAPDAPAANSVVIYAVDNGAGKTQLMARFPTGSAQQLAIEP